MVKIVAMRQLLPYVVIAEHEDGRQSTSRVFVDPADKKVYKAQGGMGDLMEEIKTAVWEEYAKTQA